MKKKIQTPAFQKLLNDFESFIKVRNYKLGKGNMHKSAITEFIIWMEEKGIVRMKDITSKEVVQYFEYLIVRPNLRRAGSLASSSIKLHMYSLSLFMQNLLENKVIDNGFYIPSYSDGFSKNGNTLTVEEIKTVYTNCQNHLESALLSLAYGCGLRRTELKCLNLRDVNISNAELIVRDGKGSKRRTVPLSDTVIRYLKIYISDERSQRLVNNEEAFFINPKGNRMSGEHLNDTLKKMIEQTNNYELIQKDITLHCMRHSIANHLAENNAGIDFIRRFLGHAEINTTYIYAIRNKKRKPVVLF